MSESTASLRKKISGAGDLQSVVRTMKAVAASSIGQYERSVSALSDYYRTVELGLGVCFRKSGTESSLAEPKQTAADATGAVVFGSDQGLVGQFNEEIADYAVKTLAAFPGKPEVWAVGERVHERLAEAGIPPVGTFALPNSVRAIVPLVGQIQIESEAQRAKGDYARLYLFHNRPKSGALYEPVSQRLLPFDAAWQKGLAQVPWPGANLPEVMSGGAATLRGLIREYLFISLFRACAESLASENASRLAAMQRAEKNIDELLDDLNRTSHRLRQSGIDEELFDVISGFEALTGKKKVKPVEKPVDLTTRISARAYQIYESHGRRDGKADEDWIEAEHEIQREQSYDHQCEGFPGSAREESEARKLPDKRGTRLQV